MVRSWVLITAPACLASGAGTGWILLRHRQVKNAEGLAITDPQGH
ncbi:hypothetical protein [Antrihabitans cavernicola]|nr:hypothetical protein [Spelaeibacter cavernicola]